MYKCMCVYMYVCVCVYICVCVFASLSLVLSRTLTAIVGESGSGKSTVAALLLGFYTPEAVRPQAPVGCMGTDACVCMYVCMYVCVCVCVSGRGQGTVRVGGEDVRTLPPGWVRGRVAWVGQEPALFAKTIADNIAYGRSGQPAPMAELEAAARLAHAHDFIQSLPQGYATPVGERGGALSAGQRQRIAIARGSCAGLAHPTRPHRRLYIDARSQHTYAPHMYARGPNLGSRDGWWRRQRCSCSRRS
jgi:energy-coupling factor transporter ATP-binding protein EcfA2